jgi:Zn-dependent protease
MTSQAPPPSPSGGSPSHTVKARAHVSSHGLRIGSIAGVPVYLGRTWPVIVLVVVATFGPSLSRARPELGWQAYAVALVYALLLLFSVLFHEAAHAVVGRWRGYRVSRIVADLWGGHTAYDTADSTPGSSALVSVAGPVANGILALVGWWITPMLTGDIPHLLGLALLWTNGFVALFNLLPGLPLDGGFLVDSLVWKITGSREKGMIAAGWCGRAVTVGVLVWVVVLPLARGDQPSLFTIIWGGFIGAFLWAGATQAIRAGRSRQVLERITIGSVWRPAGNVRGVASAVEARSVAGRLPPRALLVVTGPDGVPAGLVDPAALAAIPDRLLDQTPVLAVMRAQPDGWVVDATPHQPITAVVAAMQELRVGTIAVRTPSGRVDGVVLASDL